MSTIHQLGSGRLRVLTEQALLQTQLSVALDHPLTGHRLTLRAVPDQQRAVLVAVIDGPGTDIPARAHFANSAATGFVIGAGLLIANRPAPGLGPADRIGIEPEPGKPAWQRRVLDRLEGRHILLEAHLPGCRCGAAVPIPRQRVPQGAAR